MKRRTTAGITAVLGAVGLVTCQAGPAAADTYCPEVSPGFVQCTQPTGYFALGGRNYTKVEGTFSAIYTSQEDKMSGEGTVYDLIEDGYRARVWLDIFEDCFCVNESRRIRGSNPDNWIGMNSPNPGLTTRLFDSHVASGQRYIWSYAWPSHRDYTHYTVRIMLGRYQASTGRFDFRTLDTYFVRLG